PPPPPLPPGRPPPPTPPQERGSETEAAGGGGASSGTEECEEREREPPLLQLEGVEGEEREGGRARVFEGVYNNSRMLHFLTAVVGSRCDVMVKNGSIYEGIFKTLSSRCELAVDAVHKVKNEEGDGGGGGGTPVHPRREEITDTMIFGPNDLVTMICRDVDLNYATRDTFTDSAIGSRINGDHREKVLQRWDGGNSNGENFDLDADTSNGWDASEMFRFNEETYGVKSTYDSSLSMYTVPLERGSSEGFRQREARAARLASEIEGSLQYRYRVALENEEGRTEEDKYSAVLRDRDRDGGERERGRDSPGFSSAGSREAKYIPLPQRAREREMGVSGRGERGGAVSTLPNRANRPGPSSSSPRPLPSGSGQTLPPTDRSSPLSVRGGYSAHQSQSSPPTQPRPSEPGHSSPPSPHTLPHSLSHPQSLSDSLLVCSILSLLVINAIHNVFRRSQVKKSTLNPNAKEFNPTKAPLSMVKPSATPTPPRPTPPSPTVVLQAPPGKYQRTKGSVVTPRPDHSSSAPPMIQAAASAAGPPLVASPYPPSYLQYNQVIQAMSHYPGQVPMYSMLQGGPRMLGSGGHPQTLGPPGPQYPGQTEGPPGPQQGMYAPQSFSHHSGSIHHPQPSSTPTGSQPPPQHPAPSPGQSGQSGPQPQSLYHSGPLSAPTPPNLPPGHSSPQASYSLQGYSLQGHQPLPHPYSSLGQLTQVMTVTMHKTPPHRQSHF
uniref:Ataxin-2-like protein n=1 Tax=Sinocyclocheilus anshuiensis TaxID=1608454 RepID=A0A671MW77_9TELE